MITKTEAQFMAREVSKLTQVDIFAKTRKTPNVYVRSMFNHVLKNAHGWGLSRIANLYKENGYKGYDHATVHHSLKMWDTYVKYYPELMQHFEIISDTFSDTASLRNTICSKLRFCTLEQLESINKVVSEKYKQAITNE